MLCGQGLVTSHLALCALEGQTPGWDLENKGIDQNIEHPVTQEDIENADLVVITCHGFRAMFEDFFGKIETQELEDSKKLLVLSYGYANSETLDAPVLKRMKEIGGLK